MSTQQFQPSPLKVGVLLLLDGVQLLDVAAVDLLAMLQPSYLRASGLPENVVALGREVEFHYIADVVKANLKDGVTPTEAPTTPGAMIRVTDTLDSVDKLDILFIPGPAPTYVPSPDTLSFIQKQTATAQAVLIVCSGILAVLPSGILSGKTATAPLGLLPLLREKAPGVKWVAKRWAVDSDGEEKGEKKIWTSGGVTNGTDMVAAFLKHFVQPELAKLVCALADVGDRSQEYPEWQLNLKLF